MEELKLWKSSSKSQAHLNENEAPFLYTECCQHVSKLHDQIGRNIQSERMSTLDKSINEIENLNRIITQLSLKIKYEQTNDEIIEQREVLLIKKQALLSTIKLHCKCIKKLQKQMRLLNIKEDQIKRQIAQYRNVLQNKKYCQILAQSICLRSQTQQPQSQKQNQLQKSLIFPVICSKRPAKQNAIAERQDKKWSAIDGLYRKLRALDSESLVETLYNKVQQQNSSLRTILKGYNMNGKMSELSKDATIKKQLEWLLKAKKLI